VKCELTNIYYHAGEMKLSIKCLAQFVSGKQNMELHECQKMLSVFLSLSLTISDIFVNTLLACVSSSFETY
jgi:hypothetical protein